MKRTFFLWLVDNNLSTKTLSMYHVIRVVEKMVLYRLRYEKLFGKPAINFAGSLETVCR